jgi:hypothetical protein
VDVNKNYLLCKGGDSLTKKLLPEFNVT